MNKEKVIKAERKSLKRGVFSAFLFWGDVMSKETFFNRSQEAHKKLAEHYSFAEKETFKQRKNRVLLRYHTSCFELQRDSGRVLSKQEKKDIFDFWNEVQKWRSFKNIKRQGWSGLLKKEQIIPKGVMRLKKVLKNSFFMFTVIRLRKAVWKRNTEVRSIDKWVLLVQSFLVLGCFCC